MTGSSHPSHGVADKGSSGAGGGGTCDDAAAGSTGEETFRCLTMSSGTGPGAGGAGSAFATTCSNEIGRMMTLCRFGLASSALDFVGVGTSVFGRFRSEAAEFDERGVIVTVQPSSNSRTTLSPANPKSVPNDKTSPANANGFNDRFIVATLFRPNLTNVFDNALTSSELR